MIDEAFHIIERHQLVNWGVIYHGVVGVPFFTNRLSDLLVKKFAEDELNKIAPDDPQLDVVVKVATESYSDRQGLQSDFEALCHSKGVDLTRALRIWRAATLQSVTSSLNDDPVYGLIELNEFWAAWSWPDDAPPSMRPNAEKLSEIVYHSRQNYERVIREQIHWLDRELKSIH